MANASASYSADIIALDISVSRQQERWLSRAENIARQGMLEENPYGGNYHLGAVIVKSGRLMATGMNRTKNDPMLEGEDPKYYGEHAEMAALRTIRGADNNYSAARGATIYVARALRSGATANARPCDNCLKELTRVGITSVVYTTQDNDVTIARV